MTDWRRLWVMLAVGFAAVFTMPSTLRAQANADWTEPFPPFRIAGNLYYVGSKDLAIYLVTTPHGHILINSGLEVNCDIIETNN